MSCRNSWQFIGRSIIALVSITTIAGCNESLSSPYQVTTSSQNIPAEANEKEVEDLLKRKGCIVFKNEYEKKEPRNRNRKIMEDFDKNEEQIKRICRELGQPFSNSK